MSDTVYFVSDTHFGAGEPEDQARRVRRFCTWVDGLRDASHLYLLGDIFDFWLDYPTFMPKDHLEVLFSLKKLKERGTQLVFVGGNHDVWCESFFEETLGVPALPGGSVVEHQGLRLRLDHGDGLLQADRFYSIFRRVVRNPVVIFVAKSIHPELLHRLALFVSRRSRNSRQDSSEEILRLIRRYGASHSHADVDHLVTGHVHTPCQIDFDGWRFTNLGDWVVSYTAARLRQGEFELLHLADELGD